MEQIKAVFNENRVQIHGKCFWILASHVGLDGKHNEIPKAEGRAESFQHSAGLPDPIKVGHHPSHSLEMSKHGQDDWCPRSFVFSEVTIKRAGWLSQTQTPTLTRSAKNPTQRGELAQDFDSATESNSLGCYAQVTVSCSLCCVIFGKKKPKLFWSGYSHNCDSSCGCLPWWVSCDCLIRNSLKQLDFCTFLL